MFEPRHLGTESEALLLNLTGSARLFVRVLSVMVAKWTRMF